MAKLDLAVSFSEKEQKKLDLSSKIWTHSSTRYLGRKTWMKQKELEKKIDRK